MKITPRERDALVELLNDGADNETIARRMGVQYDTAKTHLRNLLAKSGMPNRTALALAVERGEIVPRVVDLNHDPRAVLNLGGRTFADTGATAASLAARGHAG